MISINVQPKFQLGALVATPAAMDAFSLEEIAECLNRHASGDWGDLDEEDIQANNDALKEGERLFSSYTFPNRKLWIITEWNRSATTLLLPDDY